MSSEMDKFLEKAVVASNGLIHDEILATLGNPVPFDAISGQVKP